MVQLTPQRRIFLAVAPIDGRKGIDSLTAGCRQVLSDNPLGGAVCVFRTRSGTTRKLLADDGQGLWLCTQRLSQGRFHWWPTTTDPRVTLAAQELSLLFWNGHPDRAQFAPLWRPLTDDGTSVAE